jgi:hypothetical protein
MPMVMMSGWIAADSLDQRYGAGTPAARHIEETLSAAS